MKFKTWTFQYGIMFGFDLLLGKFVDPWVTLGPTTAFTAKRMKGVHSWVSQCPSL